VDYVLATIRDTVERCESSDSYNPQAVLRGLELLGRHLAMFTDKTVNKHTVEDLTDAEIEAQLAEYDHRKTTPRSTH
jgi:hypothetical protein